METIPTPRTEAVKDFTSPEHLYWECQKMERELHIAKQALEKIVDEGDNFNSDRAASALRIAENAIKAIDLSA